MNFKTIDSAFIKRILEENQRYRLALTTIATCDLPYAPMTDHSVLKFYEETARNALEGETDKTV